MIGGRVCPWCQESTVDLSADHWTVHGRCRGRTDAWFPTGLGNPDDQDLPEDATRTALREAGEAAAARECMRCPVRHLCRDYAHEIRPKSGIWAGERWVDGRCHAAVTYVTPSLFDTIGASA